MAKKKNEELDTNIINIADPTRELLLRGVQTNKKFEGYNSGTQRTYRYSIQTYLNKIISLHNTKHGRIAVVDGGWLIEAKPDTQPFKNLRKATHALVFPKTDWMGSYYMLLKGIDFNEEKSFIQHNYKTMQRKWNGKNLVLKKDIDAHKRKLRRQEEFETQQNKKHIEKDAYNRRKISWGRGKYYGVVRQPYYVIHNPTSKSDYRKYGLEEVHIGEWSRINTDTNMLIDLIVSGLHMPLNKELTLWYGRGKTTVKKVARTKLKQTDKPTTTDNINAVFERNLVEESRDTTPPTFKDSICSRCPNRLSGITGNCTPNTKSCIFNTRLLVAGEYIPKAHTKHILTKLFDGEFNNLKEFHYYNKVISNHGVHDTQKIIRGYHTTINVTANGIEYNIPLDIQLEYDGKTTHMKYDGRKRQVDVHKLPEASGYTDEQTAINMLVDNKFYENIKSFYQTFHKKVESAIKTGRYKNASRY